jgi:hypothetical protein
MTARRIFTMGVVILLLAGGLNPLLSDDARLKLADLTLAICIGAAGWVVVAWLWTRPRRPHV